MRKAKQKILPESEIRREKIIEKIERWAVFTKVQPHLRDHDIPSLACSILDIFYHITLCCGHMVNDMNEGVNLEMDDYADGEQGTSCGVYCKVCADEYIKEGFARKPNVENNAQK